MTPRKENPKANTRYIYIYIYIPNPSKRTRTVGIRYSSLLFQVLSIRGTGIPLDSRKNIMCACIFWRATNSRVWSRGFRRYPLSPFLFLSSPPVGQSVGNQSMMTPPAVSQHPRDAYRYGEAIRSADAPQHHGGPGQRTSTRDLQPDRHQGVRAERRVLSRAFFCPRRA